MFDFIRRACAHPLDYWPVLRWHRVKLIRHEAHAEDIHSFIFAKPAGLQWKAGQHGVWWFFGKPLSGKNWRAFSIASSVHENELRISTTIGPTPSAFKQKLLNLQVGDTIWLQGPFGEFHRHDYPKLIGVAGGIGITPFRALTYELAHGLADNTELDLIYSARAEYTFKQELDEWINKTPQLRVRYTHTPEEVQQAMQELSRDHGKSTPILLSGSPGMITAITNSCHAEGYTKVISDPFKGY